MRVVYRLIKDITTYIIIIILSLFIGISLLNNLGFSKYKFYDILTGSMSPAIEPGSLVIVKKVNSISIKNGDIITFKSKESDNITTHRVSKVINDGNSIRFQTKGDANNVIDPIIIDENLVVGKVIAKISNVGLIMRWISKYRVEILVLIIVCIILKFIFNKE